MNTVLGFKSRLVWGGMAVALMIGLAACGGPPKWVKQGSGAFNEKDSKGFYGVGSVAGVRNEPLAWDTAENRARAEIVSPSPRNLDAFHGCRLSCLMPFDLGSLVEGENAIRSPHLHRDSEPAPHSRQQGLRDVRDVIVQTLQSRTARCNSL